MNLTYIFKYFICINFIWQLTYEDKKNLRKCSSINLIVKKLILSTKELNYGIMAMFNFESTLHFQWVCTYRTGVIIIKLVVFATDSKINLFLSSVLRVSQEPRGYPFRVALHSLVWALAIFADFISGKKNISLKNVLA